MKRRQNAFSSSFNEALIKTEMVREMAIEDGWTGLDQCLQEAPKALNIFLRHAEAALRAIKKIEERERHTSSETEDIP